jgi:hypothetical protein
MNDMQEIHQEKSNRLLGQKAKEGNILQEHRLMDISKMKEIKTNG